MLKRLAKTVIDFWIKPVRAEPMALFRICISLIVLLDTSITLLPYAADWYGVTGLYPPESIQHYVDSYKRWSLIPAAASDETVRLGLWALIVCAAASTFGLLTRFATVGMWALLVSFHMRNPLILNGGDILLRASTFYVMLMPGGAAWSFDNLIRRRLMQPVQPGVIRKVLVLPFTHLARWDETFRGEASTGWVRPWTLRLAQIQLAVVYFFTGIDKVRGVNPGKGGYGDWVGGDAVGLALNHGTIARFEFLTGWPLWIFAPATWITLAWEVAFPLLVLWGRTRWYALSLGVLLHVGIFATMEVTHFSWTILSYYWLLIPAAVLIDMAGKATGSTEERINTVFYDGMCPVCKKSKRTLERLDWLGRLKYADIHDRQFAETELPDVTYADMLKQMYVKRPDGSYFGGYYAFRAMAPMLPLCWALVPFLWLPGAAFVGTRVYRFIAKNRFKYAKCDDEFRSLHLKLLAGNEVDDEVIAKVIALHEKYRASKPEPGAPATG